MSQQIGVSKHGTLVRSRVAIGMNLCASSIHALNLLDNAMEMLLAILLWIGCISAPNSYHQSQIDAYSTQHEQVVNSVLMNPPQQIVIWQQYGSQVPYVDVFDPYD